MKEIIAIIVLYKLKLSESQTFSSLSSSLSANNKFLDLIIYDNSPEFNEGINFDEYKNWNIIYLTDTTNSGVSKAYNLAADFARKNKKKWLLLFDQDTIFPIDTINKYWASIRQYPGYKIFSPVMISENQDIISPSLLRYGRAFNGKEHKPGVYSFKNKSLINCALCIEVDAFRLAGGYNNNIKLDFSDHDFIKRFKKRSASEFVLIDLKVLHQLSVNSKNSVEHDKIRYKYYLQGVNFMAENPFEYGIYTFHAFLRGLKLSIQHKTPTFLSEIVKNIFKKNDLGH